MSRIFGGFFCNIKTMYLKLQNTRHYNKAKIALISSCSIKLATRAGRLANYWLQVSNTIQQINCTFCKVITAKPCIFCRILGFSINCSNPLLVLNGITGYLKNPLVQLGTFLFLYPTAQQACGISVLC